MRILVVGTLPPPGGDAARALADAANLLRDEGHDVELLSPDFRSASHRHGFFRVDYRGARYSIGYPACPDLADRAKMVRLLKPSRIGVELSEEMQLHPEQSTDAIVVHHPEAKYFSV